MAFCMKPTVCTFLQLGRITERKATQNQPAQGNFDSSTKLVAQQWKTSRLTETSIPVLRLYYEAKNTSRLTETSIPVQSNESQPAHRRGAAVLPTHIQYFRCTTV